MDLALTEAQELLRRNAREFLAESCPSSVVREVEERTPGISRSLWRSMAELGWLGLGLPVEVGGSGGDAADLSVLAEELGRANAPVPWISSVVLGGQLLAASGGSVEHEVLGRVIDGGAIVAVASREADVGYGAASVSLSATMSAGEYRLDGAKMFVTDGACADWLITLARVGEGQGEEGLTLFLVDAKADGLTVEWQPTTQGDATALVRYQGVRPATLLVGVGAGWSALAGPTALATALLCSSMLGGAERALEMAVAYAKERVQFGRPIGAFQAVSHKLAEVRWKLSASRVLTDRAVTALAAGEEAQSAVSMAMAYTSSAVRWSLLRCHEVFAGIGFMKIHDLQLYFRRLRAAETRFGDESFHRERVIQRDLLGRGTAI